MERVTIPKLVHEPRLNRASVDNIFGILKRIREKSTPKHTFIDGVTKFEHFLSQLTLRVYMDFPSKLKGLARESDNSNDSDVRRGRLVELILESVDREEMISKLVEEKVRSIFYGNPIDLFEKDRAKIGFGKFFKENDYGALLRAFQEITARRNVIMHGQGRVDRKYISEVAADSSRLGQVIDIDEQYLRTSFLVMKDLGAAAAQRVSTAVYGHPLSGIVRQIEVAARRRPAV